MTHLTAPTRRRVAKSCATNQPSSLSTFANSTSSKSSTATAMLRGPSAACSASSSSSSSFRRVLAPPPLDILRNWCEDTNLALPVFRGTSNLGEVNSCLLLYLPIDRRTYTMSFLLLSDRVELFFESEEPLRVKEPMRRSRLLLLTDPTPSYRLFALFDLVNSGGAVCMASSLLSPDPKSNADLAPSSFSSCQAVCPEIISFFMSERTSVGPFPQTLKDGRCCRRGALVRAFAAKLSGSVLVGFDRKVATAAVKARESDGNIVGELTSMDASSGTDDMRATQLSSREAGREPGCKGSPKFPPDTNKDLGRTPDVSVPSDLSGEAGRSVPAVADLSMLSNEAEVRSVTVVSGLSTISSSTTSESSLEGSLPKVDSPPPPECFIAWSSLAAEAALLSARLAVRVSESARRNEPTRDSRFGPHLLLRSASATPSETVCFVSPCLVPSSCPTLSPLCPLCSKLSLSSLLANWDSRAEPPDWTEDLHPMPASEPEPLELVEPVRENEPTMSAAPRTLLKALWIPTLLLLVWDAVEGKRLKSSGSWTLRSRIPLTYTPTRCGKSRANPTSTCRQSTCP